jgi:hypothetical protein
MRNASIGFRSKTGKAIVVALSGSRKGPEFIGRWDVLLHDPATPATFQPFHEVMEMPWPEAQRAARLTERAIEKIAYSVLSDLKRELKKQGYEITAVGVTGSPDSNLEKIGNFHVRAHAAEGILFRRVVEVAAEKQNLKWRGFSDRNILQTASDELKISEERLNNTLTAIGKIAGPPWRLDERAAAVSAWIVSQ